MSDNKAMTQNGTRTALITGASRGLGLALARALADRGWRLIIDARGAAELEAARAELAQRTTVTAVVGDVTDPGHRAALASAAQAAGGLDTAVNNASWLGPSPQPSLLDYPLGALAKVYETNVIAPLAVLQAVWGSLKPGACVINVSSDAGREAYAGWGGYGSSKAALEQLSAILAAENPDRRIYWVDPGDMNNRCCRRPIPAKTSATGRCPRSACRGSWRCSSRAASRCRAAAMPPAISRWSAHDPYP